MIYFKFFSKEVCVVVRFCLGFFDFNVSGFFVMFVLVFLVV